MNFLIVLNVVGKYDVSLFDIFLLSNGKEDLNEDFKSNVVNDMDLL